VGDHRKYIPRLLEMVAAGMVDPTRILTQEKTFGSAIESYEAFDQRQHG
jgi:threonine dehydrogenase-like Zn-dependent dehydrogenase